MTDQERRAAAVQQLTAASAAHFEYETTALQGVYDQQWAEWYADYLVQHGWNDLFEQAWTVQDLTDALCQADAAHRQNEPDAQWHDYYAPRLLSARK